MVACNYCHKENQPHYKFCLYCGSPLESPARSKDMSKDNPEPAGSAAKEPDSSQGVLCHLANKRRNVRGSECAETILGYRKIIGIIFVAENAVAEQNEQRLKIALKQHVNVCPFAQIAAVSHPAKNGIIGRFFPWATVLDSQPAIKGL